MDHPAVATGYNGKIAHINNGDDGWTASKPGSNYCGLAAAICIAAPGL